MASMISSSNRKPFVFEKRPLMMLKDYLQDDFSSCSSNGFKSFPRRQCCTTVRFLLEIDLNSNSKPRQQHFRRSKSSKSASSTFSALHKAVINAVKLLPFPSSNSKSSSPSASKFLPRSFSRKLFKKSFWRKVEPKERGGGGQITRSRLFHEFLIEGDNTKSNINHDANQQHLTSSSGNCNSNSWSENEFSGNSKSYCSRNTAVRESAKDSPIKKLVSDGVGVPVAKEWANEEDKEQFSPVSVLDCPFQDEAEEEDNGCPFQRRLDHVEGAKQKLLAKIRSFESLAQLNPVNLEKQIELAGCEDDESIKSTIQTRSLSIDVKEERAQELLELVKTTLPSSNSLISNAESVLLDFFREKILENNASSSMVKGSKEFKQELEAIQDWLNGNPQEMFLGWEVKESRHIYVKEMEKSRKWRNLSEEKEELILEFELEIFTSLVNEALFDLLS
ncbi:uncharacterized protein LOC8265402 [Ricinus communis]|uniref:DUF4378 domain-containing protein n=1 Tax=Ricinus communis TaxID=3988 RepID=B9RC17_RICCO|nr:uncharacterized protein LOC8265402 [Ricinus communis]EEF51088.1 conserved hypothetical protein [Ricinus communis]|eukprot:XP_002509701.1 uncharacterized protein LOC8265402 [Ricinus communis]